MTTCSLRQRLRHASAFFLRIDYGIFSQLRQPAATLSKGLFDELDDDDWLKPARSTSVSHSFHSRKE
jgi:hypothetical protein